MAASMKSLPLLHKYVLSPQDDMELTMTKLKFRLCVKEVSDVLQTKSRVMDLTPDQPFEDESPSPFTWKTDDSGLEHDFSVFEDSRCGQNFNEISEEFDVSRQTDSFIDETCDQESFATASSSSPSSSESEEEQELISKEQEQGEDQRIEEQEQDNTTTQDREETGNPESQKDEIFENFYVKISDVDGNPRFGEKKEQNNENVEVQESSLSLPNSTVVTGSEGIPPEEAKSSGIHCDTKNRAVMRSETVSIGADKGEGKSDCNDVTEALRILKTRSELPKITTRRNTIVTFSSWNVTDLVRSPQKATTIERPNQTIKRKSELQATNERILSRERKFAEIYKKIRERDEEDQRLMMEDVLKKQKIPVAKPLPPPSPATTTTTTTVTSVPPTSDSIPKAALDVADKAENPKTRSKEDDRLQKPNSQTGKNKNKKKHGGILNSVVQSLQRRFSRRGRETTTTQ